MAMVIANNNAAMLTLGEINKNNSALGKQLKKISSGMKINSAGDDASGYAISERMRTRLRSLDQDIRNTQTGSSLLRVADGAVANIIEEMRSLKELALNAANDTNTDLDRATIQKEFEHRKANINDIAAETNYNGKILLDGRYSATRLVPVYTLANTSTTTSTVTSAPDTSTDTKTRTSIEGPNLTTTTDNTTIRSNTPPASTGTTTVGPTTTTTSSQTTTSTGPTPVSNTTSNTNTVRAVSAGQMTETITTTNVTTTGTESANTVTDTTKETTVTTVTTVTSTPVTEPETHIITNDIREITTSGIWQFAPDYTGVLKVTASDVVLVGSGTVLMDTRIEANDVSDLYLKNVHLQLDSYSGDLGQSGIAFHGNTPSKLHLIGTNTFEGIANGVHAESDLSIIGAGTLNLNTRWYSNYGVIGIIPPGSGGDISIGQGTTIAINFQHQGSGGDSFPAIGTSYADETKPHCSVGNISIGTNANVSINYTGFLLGSPIIGAGHGETCGNITIYSGANVSMSVQRVFFNSSVAIGASEYATEEGYPNPATCGDITIYSNASVSFSAGRLDGNGIGVDRCSNNAVCGDITIYSYDSGNVTASPIQASSGSQVRLLNQENIVTGGELDTTDPSISSIVGYDVTTTIKTTTAVTVTTTDTTATTRNVATTTETTITTNIYDETGATEETGNPLVIHHGTKANEALNVYLEDMHTWALKDEIPSDDDILELARMDTTKAAAYKAMLDEAKDMTLDEAKVTTQHDANVSLRVIDGALNYALEQATHIGAYISRLDFTEANLVTANESTLASESTIRDADMAKEMAEYTKANVLLQASQSMLAQANQNSSQVLSLLQ